MLDLSKAAWHIVSNSDRNGSERHLSIVGFHRVLIFTAILFCLGFSTWTGLGFLRDKNGLDLLLASAFLLAAFGLSYYLIRLKHFLGRETE